MNRLPPPRSSPKDLARKLKVHRTLASRLLGALRLSDPLAVIATIPGKQGLDAILQAAEPIVGAGPVGEARIALEEFDTIVEHGLGGREVLDVALGAWLPEMREKQELSCKQLIYRGMCGLSGASAEVTIGTGIRFANADGEHADLAMLFGLVGLRRLSPGRRIPLGSIGMIPGVRAPSGAYIEHLPPLADPGPPILRQFSTTPLPEIGEIRLGNYRQFMLPGEEIGNTSIVNIFTAIVVRKIGPLYRDEGSPPRRTGGTHVVEVPTRAMIMDLLVDESETPLRNPQVLVHRTGQRGAVDPNDPLREIDRVDCHETIQSLGRGPERFGTLEAALYPEMIRYVCEQLGLDCNRLVGQRCRVQYPLQHVQYSMGYELPTRSEVRQRQP
ncbi:MAG: hypothetical protein JNG88_11360 [Phycisphaerales bacterium]|nr:hypothetical protein [Phycisphaerales bacterium]